REIPSARRSRYSSSSSPSCWAYARSRASCWSAHSNGVRAMQDAPSPMGRANSRDRLAAAVERQLVRELRPLADDELADAEERERRADGLDVAVEAALEQDPGARDVVARRHDDDRPPAARRRHPRDGFGLALRAERVGVEAKDREL